MDIRHYLALLMRRWKEIVVIVLLVLGAAYVSTRQIVQPTYSSTLFLSFGVDRSKNIEGYYGGINASDGFAETVQGWVKDPGVLAEVRKVAGDNDLDLSARKQERQNIIVSIGNGDDGLGAKTNAEAVLKVLEMRLAEFNQRTNNSYAIGLSSVTTQVNVPEDKLRTTLLIALFFGLILGVAWGFVFEFLFGRVSFVSQLKSDEDWQDVIEIVDSKSDWSYLQSFLATKNNVKLVTVDCDLPVDAKDLDLKKDCLVRFPNDLVGDLDQAEVVLMVKLGVTRISNVKKLQVLLQKPVCLVVLA